MKVLRIQGGSVQAGGRFAPGRNLEILKNASSRAVETHRVTGIVLLLRDVLACSLFATYRNDSGKLNHILHASEPTEDRATEARIAAMGGTLHIESRFGRGTQLSTRHPLEGNYANSHYPRG
jgi:hypothetical protein